MYEWLRIQCEKENYPSLRKFTQANPSLDMIMQTILAKYLNFVGPSVQKWIEDYQHGRCKCLQTHVNHSESATLREFVCSRYMYVIDVHVQLLLCPIATLTQLVFCTLNE